MVWYALPDEEHCEVVREVIAVVYEEIVRLKGFLARMFVHFDIKSFLPLRCTQFSRILRIPL